MKREEEGEGVDGKAQMRNGRGPMFVVEGEHTEERRDSLPLSLSLSLRLSLLIPSSVGSLNGNGSRSIR